MTEVLRGPKLAMKAKCKAYAESLVEVVWARVRPRGGQNSAQNCSQQMTALPPRWEGQHGNMVSEWVEGQVLPWPAWLGEAAEAPKRTRPKVSGQT